MSSVPPTELSPRFAHPEYLLRQKMLKLLGGKVDVYVPDGSPVLCSLQKAFKLKEDIRLYSDDRKTEELLTIKARQIIDFSAAYDVVDTPTGQHLGVLRRKGWRSLVQDKWEILNPQEQPIAVIEEDSLALALLRRLATNLIPQNYAFKTPEGYLLAQAKQHFNPFIHKMDLFMPQGPAVQLLDPRVVLAATVLLVLLEGRQQ